MTVLPSSDSPHFDGTDENLVETLANKIFREGPGLAGPVAAQIENLDDLPGYVANAATDLAATAASSSYRVDPTLTESIPFGSVPHAAPGALGTAASSPSGFLLRSMPLGGALPAEIVEPWRHLADPQRMLNVREPSPLDAADAPLYFLRQPQPPPGRQLSTGPVGHDGWREMPVLRQHVPGERPVGLDHQAATSLPEDLREPRRLDSGEAPFYFLRQSAPPTSQPRGAGHDRHASHDVRSDFPVLQQRVHGKRLVWLDNAATTQKPQCVIDEVARFYREDNSNVHRGAHTLAARATDAYEGARGKVAELLGASSTQEVIFVRGTTEAINLVAQSYGRSVVGPGDEIVLTTLEHHSNIVPWQMLAQERGARLKPVRITDRGDVMLDHYASLLGPRTRIVALAHVSNALGTILPVEAMAAMAKAVGAAVVVDGAQGVPHFPVDVQALGADFYAFSGHKLYGPTGVGVLWGRQALLEEMPPWQGGGQMIKRVDFESSTWNDLPYKFEAGTGTIGPAVGLGRAIDYVTMMGLPYIAAHEQALLAHGTEGLAAIPGLRLIGTSAHKAGVLSFVLDGVDVEDVGKFLDQEGIAVRAGHHCAQPALRHFGLDATVRPSLGLYNTHEDIDVLIAAVRKAASSLRR